MTSKRISSIAWRTCSDNLVGPVQGTSVGAFVMGPTRDGHMCRVALTAVYAHRGHAARRTVGAESVRRCWPSIGTPTNETGSEHDDSRQLDHTWWPRHIHQCIALSPVCGEAALSALSHFDLEDIVSSAGAERIASAVGSSVRTYASHWGALPMAVMTRAWPAPDDPHGVLSRERTRAFMVWTAAGDEMTLGVPLPALLMRGLPEPNDTEGVCDFADLTSIRDAALKETVVAGADPYTYDGVRVMSRSLQRFERVASLQERPTLISGIKAMRHRLYGSPHRLGR
ncbi:hypothetical protein pkur_cds_87 [Pandoravirus kuranda]|uniref:Uncharacterized protein n=1 Tax=Pandoravirus kuranda TaxID=3019033 RepID=A0AA95J3D8_9VIRU|nr:hypothetical protein pkur_cds_87 [Pandoravirus kuranda]